MARNPLSTDVLPPAPPAPAARPAGVPSAEVLDAEFSDTPPRHLRDYLRVLQKYRWLATTCFAAVLGVTIVVTLLTPRLYTATTRLQVARESPIRLRLKENVLNLDDSDRNVNGTSSFLATQVAALQSRDLAERVIRTRHLDENDGFLRPGADRQSLLALGGTMLGMLRPRGFDATGPRTPAESASDGQVDPVLLDRYMRWLSVQDVRGTDLIEIRFTTPSPTLSAFLTAAHTQAYMDANEEARRATDVTAKEFLGEQLTEARKQVERAQTALRDFAAAHPSVAVNQEQDTIAQRITDVSALLGKVESARIAHESRYAFLTRPENDPLAYFLDRSGIQKLHLTLLDLRAQRAALALRLGPNHPQMAELRRQETELESQLRAEVAEEVAAVHARAESTRLREESLRKKLTLLEQRSIDLRALGARYDLLKNDVETAQSLHESLLKQQMETAVNSELAASNIRVIERAEVPRLPSRPKIPLNLTLGVLAGLVLAIGAAFGCEYFDDSVKSSDDVEGLLQLPTLATVPNFALARRSAARALGQGGNGNGHGNGNGLLRDELIVLREPWSTSAEAYRTMRTAVLFSAPGAPPRVVLVTSARPAEGKTVSSVNLATTLAESGSRVLLIDCDLRKPGCHHVLGVENLRGLSSFLAGQADIASVTQALETPRLSFIPAGPTPPNPAELVGSGRMRDTLEDLREQFDFVILDTPPVVPVSDAAVLSRESDGVVLVVKGNDTPRDLVRRARDQLALAGAHFLGVVVNNVDLGWGDLYFYTGYYGYTGSYAGAPGEERA